jgi:hypothetical protein
MAYHRVREAVAAGTSWIAYVHSKSSNANVLAKPLPRPDLRAMISNIKHFVVSLQYNGANIAHYKLCFVEGSD